MTLLLHHPACEDHDAGPGNPESPARIRAVLTALDQQIPGLSRSEAPRANHEQLKRIHPGDYVDRILDVIPSHGLCSLDWDTVVSPGSGEAALRSAGAACAAVDSVLGGKAPDTFCAVRPPGHHAEPATAMGFCLFNNIAIAAAHARARHGLDRVAILDFDVHHGNGTQAAFWEEAQVLYASSHQSPLYPGTGTREETGAGNIINRPLAPGSGSAAFREVWKEILGTVRTFHPELILVSAGFDAHRLDPLANINLETEDFAWVATRILETADHCCDGRVVSTLEGGYDLNALAESVVSYLNVFVNR